MIGMDIDPKLLDATGRQAQKDNISVELVPVVGSRFSLPEASVDLLFCHQTFHHLVDQRTAINEFYRVLKPGGLLLFAESTSVYIESWIIQLLFRHPMESQKTAPEYMAMIRNAGFHVDPESISCPHLWWSQADFGIKERLLGPSRWEIHEETLLNLVAVRQ